MNKGVLSFVSILTILFLTQCGKISNRNLQTTGATSPAEETATVGVGAFSSAIHILNSNPVFLQSFNATQTISNRSGDSLFEPEVGASITSCSLPAAADTCSTFNKTKSASYSGCAIGSSVFKYMGSVKLEFNRSSCQLDTFGDSVTRTVNINRQVDANSKMLTSSDSHRDYRGNTLSGGSKLSKISGGYQVDITGLRKIRTGTTGTATSDISLRTVSPFFLADINQNSLTTFAGTLEVIHNSALFTATVTSNDLGFNQTTCCYPTSGSMNVSFTGSLSGSATITFSSCGSATFTREGKAQTLRLTGCE